MIAHPSKIRGRGRSRRSELRDLSLRVHSILPTDKGEKMARKTVVVSDQSGETIPDGKGAKVRITFTDARKGVRELDLTDAEAERLGGSPVARRGRRPKSSS